MGHTATRREFLQTAALAASPTLLPIVQGAVAGAERRFKSVVLILIDDLRFDGLSITGHPFIETPNIDSLAKNGALFDRAFVTASLCSPSRASILTGLYAHAHGVMNNSTLLPQSTPTFPNLLKNASYKTAFIGKWHMGGDTDEPQPGFEHWVSFRGQGVYRDPVLNINGERTKTSGYVTDIITDHAISFIQKAAAAPFFLYVSHKAVHADFSPADRHKDTYKDKTYPRPASMADAEENYQGKPRWVRDQRTSWHGVDGMYNGGMDYDTMTRSYAETMLAVDDSVGRIVETLRAQGLLDSTLLLFTSDNGFLFGEHGLIDKRCMYEPSIRVPLIAHCPELIAPSRKISQLVVNIDLAPTILDFAGVETPTTMQGKSFLPLLREEETAWRDAFLYEYFWESSFPHTPTVFGVRTASKKLITYYGVHDVHELYDQESDSAEMNNLLQGIDIGNQSGPLGSVVQKQASPETRAIYNEMNKRLGQLLEESGCSDDPAWGKAATRS